MPLEQITSTTTLWYHHDQIRSTRVMTDGTGNSKASYTYDPYGDVLTCTGATVVVAGANICTGAITVSNPFAFAGQYRDGETGDYYLRARYYDLSSAQFLTRDPAIAMTRSPYAYVNGNPLNGDDPSGRGWCGIKDRPQTCSTIAPTFGRCNRLARAAAREETTRLAGER